MTRGVTGETETLLRQHALFASADVDEVRVRVAEVLNDHWLEPCGASLAARFYGIKADSISVCMLEYGEAVTVETQPAGSFVLVQTAVCGSVSVESLEGRWTVSPGCAVILPSSAPLRLEWEAGATQVILKVPLSRLHAAYSDLTGSHPCGPLEFNREIELDSVDGEQWNALLRYFCGQLAETAPIALLKARVAEDALMRHLLCAQSISLHEHLSGRHRMLAPKQVRRAREFMESRLQESLSLQEVADHAGVSTRSLSRAFQLQYGMSPLQWLRTLRLDRIRSDLRSASSGASVSEVAMRWGWSHLGRFAAAYRQRFGEAPHETLRNGPERMH